MKLSQILPKNKNNFALSKYRLIIISSCRTCKDQPRFTMLVFHYIMQSFAVAQHVSCSASKLLSLRFHWNVCFSVYFNIVATLFEQRSTTLASVLLTLGFMWQVGIYQLESWTRSIYVCLLNWHLMEVIKIYPQATTVTTNQPINV